MDYKKKYENALERCKKAFNFNNLAYSHEEIRERLERVFPELKESESEDERIRKSLIKSFTNQHPANFPTVDGFTREQIIAWLEKQGEQKQVPITDEWIEDYWKHHKITNPNSYDKGDEVQFDHDGFVRFCNKYFQKPTWSEEDEEMVNNIVDYMRPMPIFFESTIGESGKKYTQKFIEGAIVWLKSLKERME